MKKVFYEKVGNRYIPVREYDDQLLSALNKGNYFISIKPGSTSYRSTSFKSVEEFEILGTLLNYEDALMKNINSIIQLKSNREPITLEQQQAWLALEKTFSNDKVSIYAPSLQEMINSLFKVIVEKMNINTKTILLIEEESE